MWSWDRAPMRNAAPAMQHGETRPNRVRRRGGCRRGRGQRGATEYQSSSPAGRAASHPGRIVAGRGPGRSARWCPAGSGAYGRHRWGATAGLPSWQGGRRSGPRGPEDGATGPASLDLPGAPRPAVGLARLSPFCWGQGVLDGSGIRSTALAWPCSSWGAGPRLALRPARCGPWAPPAVSARVAPAPRS